MFNNNQKSLHSTQTGLPRHYKSRACAQYGIKAMNVFAY